MTDRTKGVDFTFPCKSSWYGALQQILNNIPKLAEFWGKYDGNRRNKLIRESIFIRSIWNNYTKISTNFTSHENDKTHAVKY